MASYTTKGNTYATITKLRQVLMKELTTASNHMPRVRPNQTMFNAGKSLSMQSTLKVGEFNHESTNIIIKKST